MNYEKYFEQNNGMVRNLYLKDLIKILEICLTILLLTFNFLNFNNFTSFNFLSLSPIVSNNNVKDLRLEIRLPIIMYHNILNNTKGTYIVSEKQLDNDLNVLEDAGYTTVFPSEIVDYVLDGKVLPSKPVLITFDDGHYNNMFYALSILKKHNAKALINIIGQFSEYSSTSGFDSNPNYSHLTWKQIKELEESGVFEIGHHSYNMHNYKPRFGVKQMKDETNDNYVVNFIQDVDKLESKFKENKISKPIVYAYPFGEYNNTAKNILLSKDYKMMLTCNEGVSIVKQGDKSSLYTLKRYNRAGQYSSLDILKRVETGKIIF